MKLLLYCTKSKPYLYGHYVGILTTSFLEYDITNNDEVIEWYKVLNGTIVAECDCDKVEFIKLITDDPLGTPFYETNSLDENDLQEKACLTSNELYEYLDLNNGYALHLSNLKVFDKPYRLDDFFLLGSNGNVHTLEKAPQNMCYCYDENGEKYVLISIRPEWLCKILNGEKAIEIRKKILKEMKRLIK